MQIELAKQERYIYLQEVGPRWLLDFVSRLSQPKYFMNNIGDVETSNNPDPQALLADNLFPAFFFGPAGSQSPLHTDGALASMNTSIVVWWPFCPCPGFPVVFF